MTELSDSLINQVRVIAWEEKCGLEAKEAKGEKPNSAPETGMGRAKALMTLLVKKDAQRCVDFR